MPETILIDMTIFFKWIIMLVSVSAVMWGIRKIIKITNRS